MQQIFIHGLGQNAASWDKTLSLLPHSDNIHTPDLPALLKQKEASYAELYRALCGFCDGLPGTLDLCGLSLGAVLALQYTIDHPEKTRSAVLIGGQYRMPKALLKLQNLIFRFMPERSFSDTGFRKKDFMDLTNSMTELDFSQRLKDIACPSLIICGEKDTANKKAAQILARDIPGAELLFIEGAGHEVNTAAPEKLAAVLKQFYQKL